MSGTLWRVTRDRSVHHHLYFGSGSWSADGRHLLFISYRTGFPNLFACEWGCGGIRQITARVDLNPFSLSPSPLRREVFYTARDEVLAIQQESLEDTSLARLRGARVGNCSVDPRGERVAVSVRWPDRQAIAIVSADGSGHTLIVEKPNLSHPQFCPADPSLLLYSQDAGRRLWLVEADGGDDRLLYEAPEGEPVFHATWLGTTGEVIFVGWGGGLSAVRTDGGPPRAIAAHGIWHPAANREGTEIVCDTRDPDRGILLVDPSTGKHKTLCRPQASAWGRWWRDPGGAPDEDVELATLRSEMPEAERAPTGKVEETWYGPEWTHLHPIFSPDGRKLVFTGRRGGWPQVCVLEREREAGWH